MKKIKGKMKNIIQMLFVAAFILLSVNQAFAREFLYEKGQKSTYPLKQTTAGCSPSSAFEWLDVNNVRARVNAGGDMWWDLPGGTGAKYYIPKAGSATSIFAGSLWIGGTDINNQLKLAALRFRQVGNDYWTGPLTIDGTAAIDEATCAQFDRQWKITRAIVDEFLANTDPATGAFIPSESYTIPKEILEWPVHGDVSKQQSYYLAPFYDVDGDGEYNPFAGDYPYYDIDNSLCQTRTPTMDESIEGAIWGSVLADQVIKGDQTIWWVFNDKGNIHTETGGSAIGLEIRAQAFAFATNDEVNNMTFYSYEIINRSTFELTDTYFSPWIDTDLGKADDDFVGCDVGRGLGYCYNGKAVDGSGEPESYGEQPPAVGVDFFQGPYMDPLPFDRPKYRYVLDPTTSDTIGREQLCDESINGVNFGDGVPGNERFGMRRFVYHNNDNSQSGDPRTAQEYYNYLKGIWRNGQRMEYGGTAFPGAPGTVGPICDFMFPGDSDPCNWGTGGAPPNGGFGIDGFYWTEETGNNGGPNPPGDRRFMQSAGPFTLKPGAVNYITVGIPWARATSGGPFASVELLRVVDDKAQALFDNCFKVIDGPNAPDLAFQELDREFIVYISNSPSSNNYKESYTEFDPNIIQPHPTEPTKRSDSLYRFEGYQIFQLKNERVSVESLKDANLVRLVAQFDKKNGIGKLVNYYYDESIGATVPVVEVRGGDNGIQHSFKITQDAFATGDVRLVNHKQYYFMAIAYAHNEYMPYTDEPGVLGGLFGQKLPYLAGRKNIKTYTAIPHIVNNGLIANAQYGSGVEITRLAGRGNGGVELELSENTIKEILSKQPASATNRFGSPDYPIAYNPSYVKGKGPVNVKVIDPLNVVAADYELWMDSLRPFYVKNVTRDPSIAGDSALKFVSRWYLRDIKTNDTLFSDTTIVANDERVWAERGISIQIDQPYNIGPVRVGTVSTGSTNPSINKILSKNNGFITAQVIYQDSSKRWLDGIRDEDIPGFAINWIRSGTYKDQENSNNSDNNMNESPFNPFDPTENYEKIANGTWAPYVLTSHSKQSADNDPGPAISAGSKQDAKFFNLASVDIVMTSDKSKWTRCPVIEMQLDENLSQGNAKRFQLRKSPSVDKNGNFAASMDLGPSNNPEDANYISSYGMGWFPGYAINIETGARLNIFFGEDSFLPQFNGRDMKFNPPSKDMSLPSQLLDPAIFSRIDLNPIFGGKHFVYVMRMDESAPSGTVNFMSPAYDAGKYAFTTMDTISKALPQVASVFANRLFRQVMWVGMPMGVKGEQWLSNDVKIRIRVAKPYERGFAEYALDTVYLGRNVNNFYPKYAFSTNNVATTYRDPAKIQTDLDLITAVPNPYYAYSSYERNALDNRIKITNLPERCVITIYNMSGTKIRQFKKDEPKTSIDWDLKNFAGVPIASGVYLIHIKSDDGERIIKWFGALRPIDLNTF
ncbi:MAG: T9SS type A sorting domain-containing protein [Bacteroidales bacterium]|nr:T9SS type A sorting domain-containing protein [Bacteroidales bacterium]